MSMSAEKLARITAGFITLIGVTFFVTYLVYLPFPTLFVLADGASATPMAQTGILFYCLATAGAAFVTWGILLGSLQAGGLSRQRVLKASAVGLGLLAVMRLGTALFPHAPFEQLQLLPVSEFVVFSFVALKLYKS